MLTSVSLRILQGSGMTRAELDGDILLLISCAAATSLSVFRLEITTLQPVNRKAI